MRSTGAGSGREGLWGWLGSELPDWRANFGESTDMAEVESGTSGDDGVVVVLDSSEAFDGVAGEDASCPRVSRGACCVSRDGPGPGGAPGLASRLTLLIPSATSCFAFSVSSIRTVLAFDGDVPSGLVLFCPPLSLMVLIPNAQRSRAPLGLAPKLLLGLGSGCEPVI